MNKKGDNYLFWKNALGKAGFVDVGESAEKILSSFSDLLPKDNCELKEVLRKIISKREVEWEKLKQKIKIKRK